jgi:hypothetical protein
MPGGVKDFDVSDVPVSKAPVSSVPVPSVSAAVKNGMTAGEFATGALKFLGEKIAVNVVTQVLLSIPEKEFKRILAENELQRAYSEFFGIMAAVGKARRYECKSDELSTSCPMAMIIPQYFQSGRNSDGTAPLRMYTIIGDDGEVVNIQGFDLSQRIMITVRHVNGKSISENVSPKEAMLLMRYLAGLSKKP